MGDIHSESEKRGSGGRNMDKRILEHAEKYEVPHTLSRQEALQRVSDRMRELQAQDGRKGKSLSARVWWPLSAAAVLLLFAGIWFVLGRDRTTDIVAERGRHVEHVLPDGSLVDLNADSRITYARNGFSMERLLHLEGEAYFEVTKGESFVVSTSLADISVLGTSFNAFARNDSFKVSCLTGEILVVSGSQSLKAVPGQTIYLYRQKLHMSVEKDIQAVTGWRKGVFYFENTAINFVFNELERQFNVTFVLQDTANKYFTGSFSSSDLVEALDIVCIPMGLFYEIGEDNTVYIYGNPH